MKKRLPYSDFALPMMLARLTFASWETIMRRSVMMAQGTCSPDEYIRMTSEKLSAMQTSMAAVARGGGHAEALAPYVTKTRANVQRLRRKRGLVPGIF